MSAMKIAARRPLSKIAARMKNVPVKNSADSKLDRAQVLTLHG